MVLSKLHERCEKCNYKDECNNKRMVACGLLELPKIEPQITVNCNINISTEKTLEQLLSDIYKSLSKSMCTINSR
jgi:hypothetical protein